MKYLSDVEIKMQMLKDIKREIVFLRWAVVIEGSAIIGFLLTIIQKIH